MHPSTPTRKTHAGRLRAGTGQVAADGDEGTPGRVDYIKKSGAVDGDLAAAVHRVSATIGQWPAP